MNICGVSEMAKSILSGVACLKQLYETFFASMFTVLNCTSFQTDVRPESYELWKFVHLVEFVLFARICFKIPQVLFCQWMSESLSQCPVAFTYSATVTAILFPSFLDFSVLVLEVRNFHSGEVLFPFLHSPLLIAV